MHTNIARKTLIEMESKMYVKHVGNWRDQLDRPKGKNSVLKVHSPKVFKRIWESHIYLLYNPEMTFKYLQLSWWQLASQETSWAKHKVLSFLKLLSWR
jgi:hypothetical protein